MGLIDADTYENIEKFLLRNKGLSFIYREGEKIIATILCGHDGRRGYIYHVTVAKGINKCHLFVFTDNEAGNAFWSSIGWTKKVK